MKSYIEEGRVVLSMEPHEFALISFALGGASKMMLVHEALGSAHPGASEVFETLLDDVDRTLEDLPEEMRDGFMESVKGGIQTAIDS